MLPILTVKLAADDFEHILSGRKTHLSINHGTIVKEGQSIRIIEAGETGREIITWASYVEIMPKLGISVASLSQTGNPYG